MEVFMKKSFLFVTALLFAGALFFSCDVDEEIETIDFFDTKSQRMTIVNTGTTPLTVRGCAMFAEKDSDGNVFSFVYDERKSEVVVQPGDTESIGFSSVGGIYVPEEVSWEATFSFNGKSVIYAGWSEDYKMDGDTTERAGYGLMHMRPRENSGRIDDYIYSTLFEDGEPVERFEFSSNYQLIATASDEEVTFAMMKAGFPPINIKFADRLAYYDAFDEYHAKHNLGAMEKLFARALLERLDLYISLKL